MKLPYPLMILILAGAAAPTTQVSGTRSAECDVQVWSSYQWQPDLSDFKMALLNKLSDPAHTILNVGPDALQQYLAVSYERNPVDSSVILHLEVDLDKDARPAAKEFLDQIIAVMPSAIQNMENSGPTQMERLLDRLRGQRDFLQQQSRELKYELRDLNVLDPSADGVRDTAHKLEAERQDMLLEAAAAKAEQEAMAKAAATLSDQAAAKAADDEIAKELKNIVDIKEKRAEVLREAVRTGTGTPQDLDDAEAQVAEARVQLLERREAVAQAAGGEVLGDLQKQLVNLQLHVAEVQARSAAINKAAESLLQADDLAQKAQDAARQIDELSEQINKASAALDSAQESLSGRPAPRVRVLSGDATQPSL